MNLDSTICLKKNINNLLKKAKDQYIQGMIKEFQIWHNLCSEQTSMQYKNN
jgi:hypothetical protein